MEANLALKVRSQRTLEKAWLAIQRNARTSKSEDTKNEIATFAADLQNNIRRIKNHLQKRTFVFPPAKCLKIPKDKRDKTKFRPLVVAKVESRIVQRAIHDVLTTVPGIQDYIRTPHSFGGIKKKDDDLSSVPAAIMAVLDAINNGAKYIVRSDITSFFTKISKSSVTSIISGFVDDSEFMDLFTRSIAVELENMAQLRKSAEAFPIQDIGVAQGNSLSPLLGNIILYEFDKELNKSTDVRCIRYIDDFIILAPDKSVAENTYRKSLHILKGLRMEASSSKTKRSSVDAGFEFLGIELVPGYIRPAKKSRERVVNSIEKAVSDSIKAFREYKNTGELDRSMSLITTLNKASGIMQGWGKHYKFCNDTECLRHIDNNISLIIKKYLAVYREIREKIPEHMRWKLLGIEAVSQIERTPFSWPKLGNSSTLTTVSTVDTLEYFDPSSVPWK